MKVRAIARGVYHWIRQVGEEFDIPDHLHEPSWQEKVEDTAPEHTPAQVAETAPAPVDPAVQDHRDPFDPLHDDDGEEEVDELEELDDAGNPIKAKGATKK